MTETPARARLLASATLVALAAVGTPTPATAQEPVLANRARVQIWSSRLAPEWRTGQLAERASCTTVSIPIDESSFLRVPFTVVDSIRVSSLYDGRFIPGEPSRVYEPGKDTEGESWIPVDPEAARGLNALCSDDTEEIETLRRGRGDSG